MKKTKIFLVTMSVAEEINKFVDTHSVVDFTLEPLHGFKETALLMVYTVDSHPTSHQCMGTGCTPSVEHTLFA